MAGLSDTLPVAERELLEMYRKTSVADKARHMVSLYQTARRLHAAEVRPRNPDATEEMIQEEWRVIAPGPKLAKVVKKAMSQRNLGQSGA